MRSQETPQEPRQKIRMLSPLIKPIGSATPDDKAPVEDARAQQVVRDARISEEVGAVMKEGQRGIQG